MSIPFDNGVVGELKQPRWLIALIASVIIGSMSLEQFLITLQAACGRVTSPAIGQNSYNGHMKEISAREAKNQFGQLLESAQRAPVRVTRHGRSAGVVMSEEQYQRLRGLAWDRLASTVEDMRGEASAQGLTDEKLSQLLADDS